MLKNDDKKEKDSSYTEFEDGQQTENSNEELGDKMKQNYQKIMQTKAKSISKEESIIEGKGNIIIGSFTNPTNNKNVTEIKISNNDSYCYT